MRRWPGCFLFGVVAQVFLIGLYLFNHQSIDAHATFGWMLHLSPILVLLFAFLARAGRSHWLWALALALVVFIVPILAVMRDSNPVVAALHPVGAMLAFGLAAIVAWKSLGAAAHAGRRADASRRRRGDLVRRAPAADNQWLLRPASAEQMLEAGNRSSTGSPRRGTSGFVGSDTASVSEWHRGRPGGRRAMTLLHSAVHDPGAAMRWVAITSLIVLIALLITLVVSGPGAAPSFGLTSDPASTLWSW